MEIPVKLEFIIEQKINSCKLACLDAISELIVMLNGGHDEDEINVCLNAPVLVVTSKTKRSSRSVHTDQFWIDGLIRRKSYCSYGLIIAETEDVNMKRDIRDLELGDIIKIYKSLKETVENE